MRSAVCAVTAGFVAVSIAGIASYRGSELLFILFCGSYAGLALIAIPKPRGYVYLFLTIFLVLGFWMKTMAHFVWNAEFVEPVGSFGFTPAEWDAALALASAGALGVAVARLLHLWWSRGAPAVQDVASEAPGWFIAWRRPVWLATLLVIIAVNALNLFLAFYQVGVNPKIVLPLRLNVPLAWLINIGLALWLATLVWWDYRAGKGLIRGFLAAMLEALAASVTAHSRLFFLLHAGPYWLVAAERWRRLRIGVPRGSLLALSGSFAALLVLSLATISWLRFQQYFDMPKLPPDYTEARYYREVVERQLSRLLVQRWVGLEGTLVAASTPGRGFELFIAAVSDPPQLGANALFQKAARVPYATQDPRFTFLTNAGSIALLGFSGSVAMTFVGMLALTLMLIAVEHAAAQFTANPFFVAVAGAGMANVLSQLTFPYLGAIFILQLLAAIAFIAWLQRVR